jgi:hypothetical protein
VTAKTVGIALGTLTLLLSTAFFVGRSEGAAAQRTATDTKAEQVKSAREDSALKVAAGLRDSLRVLAKVAAASKAPHIAAIAKTDGATVTADSARKAAEQAAADLSTTADTLRKRIMTLARADSLKDAAALTERTAANLRISDDEAALAKAIATIAADSSAAVLAKQDHEAQAKIIADQAKEIPSAFSKVVRGTIEVAAVVLALVVGHSLR